MFLKEGYIKTLKRELEARIAKVDSTKLEAKTSLIDRVRQLISDVEESINEPQAIQDAFDEIEAETARI